MRATENQSASGVGSYFILLSSDLTKASEDARHTRVALPFSTRRLLCERQSAPTLTSQREKKREK